MTPRSEAPLAARFAYKLWAPTYQENPVTALDDIATATLTASLRRCSLLDAGCGTGRKLPGLTADGPRLVVGIDLVPAMLTVDRATTDSPRLTAAADIRALPFAPDTFDLIWCRLTIGYVSNIANLYAELSRVGKTNGTIIVTDFHPTAARAGHVRGFRDDAGTAHTIESYIHDPSDHEQAAAKAALMLDARLDLCVGPDVKHVYEKNDILERYEQQRGLPLLLALRFGR